MANEELRMVVVQRKEEGATLAQIIKEVVAIYEDDTEAPQVVEAEVPEVVEAEVLGKISESELMQMISEIFLKLGVPAHIKGHGYARKAIFLCVKDSELLNSVTKHLYPIIACEFGTTSSRVERAIRHAVEITWDRGDENVLNSYFGYTIASNRGKPTNSEFIAMIADKLKLQYKFG